MTFVAAALGGLGLVCVLSRRTLLGLMIGIQLLILGATMIFVLAGVASGVHVQGHLFGLFVILGGIAQLVSGYALAVRLFYLKKQVAVDELKSLKH